MPPKKGPLSQRRVALELRAAIDLARARPSEPAIAAVDDLLRDNPDAAASKHVEHNLGSVRLEWLYENGLLRRTMAVQFAEKRGWHKNGLWAKDSGRHSHPVHGAP